MPNDNRHSCSSDASGTISRRGLFHQAAAMIGGVATILVTGSQAIAKMAQKAAGYQTTPKGDQSCANCALFKAPTSCTLVDGDIVATGWCRFYAKKAS